MSNSKMPKVHKSFQLSSDVSESCPCCNYSLDSDKLPENIDHLINEHRFKLKHVGQETTRDDLGDNWQKTVAILIL